VCRVLYPEVHINKIDRKKVGLKMTGLDINMQCVCVISCFECNSGVYQGSTCAQAGACTLRANQTIPLKNSYRKL